MFDAFGEICLNLVFSVVIDKSIIWCLGCDFGESIIWCFELWFIGKRDSCYLWKDKPMHRLKMDVFGLQPVFCKKDLSVVTLPVSSEREWVIFFCWKGSFFAHVLSLFLSEASWSFCIFSYLFFYPLQTPSSQLWIK